MHESDPEELKEIVDRAKKGDKEAFSILYTAYLTPLYRYIYFRVSSEEDAEDLTQDVFIKVYSSFSRYSYTGISPLAYFYTIARNTIIDYRRKKKILIADEGEALSVSDDRGTPLDIALQKEDANMVREKIQLLSEDQQDVIVLRYIEEYSTQEIAALLGKNEEAIRQLQSRGLKSLKKKL